MIGVTPTKEQGERTCVLEGPQKAPVIHKTPHNLPLQALLSPECNKAQAIHRCRPIYSLDGFAFCLDETFLWDLLQLCRLPRLYAGLT